MVALIGLGGALPGVARAQLRPEQVLVIYDSRGSDSLAVAEYYAGSAAVGGANNRPGTRKGVRVFNLAASGAPSLAGVNDLDRATYRSALRNPIRAWLNTNDPTGNIRCLVLTRGLPYRVVDAGATPYVGENPGLAGQSFSAGTYSPASVDSELTLLWQNLDGADTAQSLPYANGAIISPYWAGRLSAGQTSVTLNVLPINAWSTARRTTTRNFAQQGAGLPQGVFWASSVLNTPNSPTVPPVTVITPGDLYLVTRLDAGSLASVFAMLDRSAGLIYADVNAAALVIDDSDNNGVTNTVDNGEFDNSAFPGGISSPGYGGDDWEQGRTTYLNDGRYAPANVVYDPFPNNAGFVVGPLLAYQGQGRVVGGPVLQLTHYGANSAGDAPGEQTNPVSVNLARSTYEQSFNLAPGAAMSSMESFNGRALGGQTPIFGQASIADFLDAGGSLAIGNVWEPFSLTVADSAQLARNFYLGNLSWAEAAYTAVPALSFQQMVLGDPLARLVRSSEDRDGDHRITVEDLYRWEVAPADLNRTGGATDADRQFVINAVRASRDTDMKGAQRP